MGLDNAGKTSILTAMKKKFNVPKQVKGLKPTIKIERTQFEFMNHLIIQADFGGQKMYRDDYLEFKDRYLSGIDLLIYAIDIQEQARFDGAVEYFDKIIEYIREYNPEIPILVLFHKLDPNIKEDPVIKSNLVLIREKFQPYIEDFSIIFKKTNIFELHTIIGAFSYGISKIYTQHQAVQDFILDYINKIENVMSFLIFDENGIEIGNYFIENIPLKMEKRILSIYEFAMHRIEDNNENVFEFTDRLNSFTKVSGSIQSVEIEGLRFFILLIVQEHIEEVVIDQFNYFEKSLPEIQEILTAILVDQNHKLN